MNWECHQCGTQHDTIPQQCRQCGTKPEVVLNLWRCQHCGQQEIPGTEMLCPQCGSTRDDQVQSRIATDRRLEGPHAIALAQGSWKYCGYCRVRVPPVDQSGKANDVCPHCGGPLSEAEKEAAAQLVSGEQAQSYQNDAVRRLGGPATAGQAQTPTAAAEADRKKRKRWPGLIALAVLLGSCVGGYLLCVHTWTKQMKVVDRSWQRTIDVESFGPVSQSDWEQSLPSDAYNKSCSRRIHHHDKVPDGTESYQEKVASGRRCAAYGYQKKGGVSVKQCTRWETQYKTVTKTRTRYRNVPVYRQHCSYTVNRWSRSGQLVAKGSGSLMPKWPDASELDGKKQRAAKREQNYALVLEYEGQRQPYECKDQAEWDRFPLGCKVIAEVTALGTLESIKPAP